MIVSLFLRQDHQDNLMRIKLLTSMKSFTTSTMKIWGGWVKEEMVYMIDAQDVKKELKTPIIKKIGRSRNVFIFKDLQN